MQDSKRVIEMKPSDAEEEKPRPLSRIVMMNGVPRTLAVDFNAAIALANATGQELFQVMQELRDPESLTAEELAAGEIPPKPIPLGKKMVIMRRLIWAMSATEHPEFLEAPETVQEVGSWFDLAEFPRISQDVGALFGEYAQRMAKANGGGWEFEGQLAPYVPTPMPVVEAAISAAEVKPGDIVFDLGAGDGRVMLRAAEAGAEAVYGYEQFPERYAKLVNRFADHSLRTKMHFRNQDLRDARIGKADVVFVYLLPPSNEEIKSKLFDEMKPGSRIVSHDFIFEGKEPSKHLTVRDEEGKLHQVYVYTIPEPEAVSADG